MANPKDFTANQIRTSQLIASGGISGTTAGLIVYSASISTDMRGGFPPTLLDDPGTPGGEHKVGEDVYFFISGSKNSMVTRGSSWGANGDQGTLLIGGDLFISGNVEVGGVFPSSTGGWTDAGTVVRLTTITDRVGIGTSSPVSKAEIVDNDSTTLTLNSVASSSIAFRSAGDTKAALVYESATSNLVLVQSGSGDETIFKSTTVGGTEKEWLRQRPSDGAIIITSSMIDMSYAVGAVGPILRLSNDSPLMNFGDFLGTIQFKGNAESPGVGAKIVAFAPAAWTAPDDYPTELQFWTCDDGAANPITQRMVIDKDGKVGIGTTTPSGSLDVGGDGETTQIFLLSGSGAKTDPSAAEFTDLALFVSGARDSAGTTTKGTAVFGGDVTISGSLVAGHDNTLRITGSMVDIGWDPNTVATDDGATLRLTSHRSVITPLTTIGTIEFYGEDGNSPGAGAKIVGKPFGNWPPGGSGAGPTELQFWTMDIEGTNPITQRMVIKTRTSAPTEGVGTTQVGIGTSAPSGTLDVVGDGLTSQIFLLSGSGGKTDPSEKVYSDLAFFVSGAIGSKDTSVKGTAVFGGDLQVSGTIYGTIAGGTAAGGWTDDGSIVRLTTITDTVGIGTVDPGPDASLAVDGGDVALSGSNLDVANFIRHMGDTDTFVEFTDNKISMSTAGSQLVKVQDNGGTDTGATIGGEGVEAYTTIWTFDKHAFTSGRLPIGSPTDSFVTILSGGGKTSPSELLYSDMSFYVSGAIGSKGTATRGTSIFGGDVVISGTLYGGSPLSVGNGLNVTGSMILSGSAFVSGSLTVSGSDTFTVFGPTLLNAGGTSDSDVRMQTANKSHAIFVDSSTDQVLILSGGANQDSDHSIHTHSDTNFFVSGTIGSKGTTERGTAVFGGDTLVSGALYVAKHPDTVLGSEKLRVGSRIGGSGPSVVFEGDTLDIGSSGIETFIRAGWNTDTQIKMWTNLSAAKEIYLQPGGVNMLLVSPNPGGLEPDDLFKVPASCEINTSAAEASTVIKTADRYAFATTRTQPSFGQPKQSIVLILSGGGKSSLNPVAQTDLGFYVSGSIGSRGTTTRGTSIFGGDVVISGSLFGGSPLSVGSDLIISGNLITSGTTFLSGSTTVSGSMTVTGSLTVSGSDTLTVFGPTLLNAGGANDSDVRIQTDNKTHALFVNSSTDQVLILSGGVNNDADFNVASWSDTNFFVSGTIGSKGTAVKGTSVFGGDMLVSGTIYGTLSGGTAAGGWVDDGTVVRLDTPTDKVGIGLPNPIAKLHLFETSSEGATILVDCKVDSSASIGFSENGSSTKAALVYEADDDRLVLVNSSSNSQLNFKANVGGTITEMMTIDPGDSTIAINNDQAELFTLIKTADRYALATGRLATGGFGNQSVVLILSGGGGTSVDESDYTDTSFYVSGSIGLKGSASTRGTSLFGGDLVTSGALYVSGAIHHLLSASNKILFDNVSTGLDGPDQGRIRFFTDTEEMMSIVGEGDGGGSEQYGVSVGIGDPGDNGQNLFIHGHNHLSAFINNGFILLLSGTSGGGTSPNPQSFTDLSFYVSGAIGSKGTSTRGTSIFGGDVVISGSLFGGSPLQLVGHRSDLGSDISLFVSGVQGSRNTSVEGTSLFEGDVVTSGSHQISGSLSLGMSPSNKEITNRTTKTVSFASIETAQIIDQFTNSDGFRCVKYIIGAKPMPSSNDRLYSEFIVVSDVASTNVTPSTTETRVFTDQDSGGSLQYLNETHVVIAATKSGGTVSLTIDGDPTYQQANGNSYAMDVSIERIVIID